LVALSAVSRVGKMVVSLAEYLVAWKVAKLVDLKVDAMVEHLVES
jgi:hypothetical protein